MGPGVAGPGPPHELPRFAELLGSPSFLGSLPKAGNVADLSLPTLPHRPAAERSGGNAPSRWRR